MEGCIQRQESGARGKSHVPPSLFARAMVPLMIAGDATQGVIAGPHAPVHTWIAVKEIPKLMLQTQTIRYDTFRFPQSCVRERY
jgi:hypothetical protein